MIGELFTIGAHVPPRAELKSPALWGTEPHVVELFGPHAADIRTQCRSFNVRYRSSAHRIEVFRDYYGPSNSRSQRGRGVAPPPSTARAMSDLPRIESTAGLGEDVRYCSGSVLVVSAVVRYPAFAKLCR